MQEFVAELQATIQEAHDAARAGGGTLVDGLNASIDVCRARLQAIHAQIKEANHGHGIEHPERTLLSDLSLELRDFNDRYSYVRRCIEDLTEALERVVVAPDGSSILLPEGHQFAGFADDGKIISATSMTVVHEDRRRATRAHTRPAQRRTRGHRRRLARRAASSSTTSGCDPGDPDSEPPRRRGELRHISTALTAFLLWLAGGGL